MGHLPRNLNKTNLNLFNSNMLGEKINGINDFKWMIASIAFGGPYAVDGEISFCNTYIFKPCYAPRGALNENTWYNCM